MWLKLIARAILEKRNSNEVKGPKLSSHCLKE